MLHPADCYFAARHSAYPNFVFNTDPVKVFLRTPTRLLQHRSASHSQFHTLKVGGREEPSNTSSSRASQFGLVQQENAKAKKFEVVFNK